MGRAATATSELRLRSLSIPGGRIASLQAGPGAAEHQQRLRQGTLQSCRGHDWLLPFGVGDAAVGCQAPICAATARRRRGRGGGRPPPGPLPAAMSRLPPPPPPPGHSRTAATAMALPHSSRRWHQGSRGARSTARGQPRRQHFQHQRRVRGHRSGGLEGCAGARELLLSTVAAALAASHAAGSAPTENRSALPGSKARPCLGPLATRRP